MQWLLFKAGRGGIQACKGRSIHQESRAVSTSVGSLQNFSFFCWMALLSSLLERRGLSRKNCASKKIVPGGWKLLEYWSPWKNSSWKEWSTRGKLIREWIRTYCQTHNKTNKMATWMLCLGWFQARRMDVESADERDVDLVEQAYRYLTVRRMQMAQQWTESKPLETSQRTESSCHFPLHSDRVRGAWGEESCWSRMFRSSALQQKGRCQRITCLITYLQRVVSLRLRIYSRHNFWSSWLCMAISKMQLMYRVLIYSFWQGGSFFHGRISFFRQKIWEIENLDPQIFFAWKIWSPRIRFGGIIFFFFSWQVHSNSQLKCYFR